MSSAAAQSPIPFSPLVLADRLITLAEQADRGGFRDVARALLKLADDALEPAPVTPIRRRPRNGAEHGLLRSA